MSYFTQQDLESFVGKDKVSAILDDDNSGFVNPNELLEIQQLADAMVDGALARILPGPFPLTQSPPPVLVRQASLLWGRCFLFERHPEYVRRYGDKPRKTAESFLDRLVEAREYLTDATGGNAKPGNVGGPITNNGPRMTIDNSDGTSNLGNF